MVFILKGNVILMTKNMIKKYIKLNQGKFSTSLNNKTSASINLNNDFDKLKF